MDQTQREFLVEIEELVEHIFSDLDELRTARDVSSRGVRQIVDRLFRRMHSVKGSAASSGLDSIRRIAHELENVLAEARDGRVRLDEHLLDTFAAGVNALQESLSFAASGGAQPSLEELFNALRAAVRDATIASVDDIETILETLPPEIRQSLGAPEKHRMASAIKEGSSLFEIVSIFEIGNFDEQFQRLKEKLAESGEVVSTSPTVDQENLGKIVFRVLYAGNESVASLEANLVEFLAVSVVLISQPVNDSPEAPSPPAASVSSLSNFVRADLDKLDHLISSTHELFRATSHALDLALSGAALEPEARNELETSIGGIRNGFLSVEDELIGLRMVALGPTFQRAARAGKDAARLVGKQIDFEILGAELRLDKLLADAVADPLVHLVRNAVDHGVETPEERLRAGKKPRGTIRIEALSEGSQTRLRVTDDGRGIDPVSIAAAAKRLGLASTGVGHDIERIDIDHGLRLIFRPGFTTLDGASEVSGRGVGLDVVETAVEQVGGELRVSTEPGRGTTFEFRLPVTFGLVATNVVVSAGNRYCIPAAQTLGIDDIDVIDGASGANQLRQVAMRDLLGQPEAPDDPHSQLHLITCQFANERPGIADPEIKCVGIVVDRVEAPQEVLVRNLGRHAGRWYGIAGAAELRDGTVALVLDLPRLLWSK